MVNKSLSDDESRPSRRRPDLSYPLPARSAWTPNQRFVWAQARRRTEWPADLQPIS